jgi:hypothetical protein
MAVENNPDTDNNQPFHIKFVDEEYANLTGC